MKVTPIAVLRAEIKDAWPRQWWRASGCGLQKDGMFFCPCCGKHIEVMPYRKGIVRVPRHGVYGKCIFSNHMEPTETPL